MHTPNKRRQYKTATHAEQEVFFPTAKTAQQTHKTVTCKTETNKTYDTPPYKLARTHARTHTHTEPILTFWDPCTRRPCRRCPLLGCPPLHLQNKATVTARSPSRPPPTQLGISTPWQQSSAPFLPLQGRGSPSLPTTSAKSSESNWTS